MFRMVRNFVLGATLTLGLAACMGGGGNAVMDGNDSNPIASPTDGIAHSE